MIPQNEPVGKLRQLFKEIITNNNGLSASEVSYIFSLARQILEERKIYQEFPLISLYANWCLHVQLERNAAKLFLEKIFNAFLIMKNQSKEKREGINFFIMRQMSEQLSSVDLKNEFLRLFEKVDIKVGRFGDLDNWHSFFAGFLKIICGNIVLILNIKESFSERMDLYEAALKEFRVTEIEQVRFWIDSNSDGHALWNLQFDGTIIYKGLVLNLEKVEDDLR